MATTNDEIISIAIVGSRGFSADNSMNRIKLFTAVDKFIQTYYPRKRIRIVTGDEPHGVDNLAQQYANARNYLCSVKVAEWMKYGKGAGPLRNKQIVKDSDVMIAFPSKEGKGTQNSIDQMMKAGKNVLALYVD